MNHRSKQIGKAPRGRFVRPSRLLPVLLCCALTEPAGAQEAITIGSKKFTESVVLGEVLKLLAENAGAPAIHKKEMGGTRVLWGALRQGGIDAYAEYTGTIRQELFADQDLSTEDRFRAALEGEGIRVAARLGFNNTYAIGMTESNAARRGIRTISDLREHPELTFGFGNEFIDRSDGWSSLRDRYALPHRNVRGMDHDLAYRGLESESVDVIDVYATDAEIAHYGLRVLVDDLGHFPVYDAVVIYRSDLDERHPEIVQAFQRLAERIPDARMVSMNARVKLDRIPDSRVAADFLAAELDIHVEPTVETRFGRWLVNTRAHLSLVLVSMLGAIAIAVPLGILAAKSTRAGVVILSVTGILQTIPTLALLVFMIPLLGVGAPPAIAALFIYSLLPIVRGTHAGFLSIPGELRESAIALGLPAFARLRQIELPLASRSLLSGIKTAAVINVGTATLGALIGAGGYGQPILTGIRLDDMGLILEGAVPAAALALIVQFAFDLTDRLFIPRGLRLGTDH